ncbi:MAG: phosphate ABC transporter substrate-binding protein PstS [Methylocystis sp.]|nr:MAG: phosphate ABC transporter substrate-binding protein PstS [Methylocystis sp.]
MSNFRSSGFSFLVLAMAIGGSQAASALELSGAGSTFAAPLARGWIESFEKDHPGTKIRYDSVGSGEGVVRFKANEVDFACTDAPMPSLSSERFQSEGPQFPVAVGMISIAYNVPGVDGELRLSRQAYANIFLGALHFWDDPQIVAANPHLHLPHLPIRPIARLDSSGTTFAFTSHLAAIDARWSETGPGVGKKVAWSEVVTLANGNEGVAAAVGSTVGAVGYAEFGVARRAGLRAASIENKQGKFVAPSFESGLAAIKETPYLGLDRLKAAILDPSYNGAYPVVTFTWLVLHWDYPEDRWRALAPFLDFIMDRGQNIAPVLGYIPLPQSIIYRGKAVVARILSSDGGAVAQHRSSKPGVANKETPADDRIARGQR